MKTDPDEEDEKKPFGTDEKDEGMHTLSTNPTMCNDNVKQLETLFQSIEMLDAEFCEPPPVLEKKASISCSSSVANSEEISTNFTEKRSSTSSLIDEKGTQTTEEFDKVDKEDFSVLQPPLDLGVKNVKQILSCVQSGSVEVQDIIFNECNIIYECKVCHNLFRCLANLLSHKRFYCKDSYSKVYDSYKKHVQSDVNMVLEPESPPELEDEDIPVSVDIDGEDSNPPPLTEIQISTPKIYTPVTESKSFSLQSREEDKDQDETFIHLEHIKQNRNAVYQTVIQMTDKIDHSVSLPAEEEKKDVLETSGTLPTSNIVLIKKDQNLKKRSDCDIKTLSCLKCAIHFDSLKRLYIHMMTTHPSKRLYYPCIYCKATFIRIYGVTRHMMKSHQKTKEQVSRIRDLIKRRAFVCKGPLPSDEYQEFKEPKTETVIAPKLHSCSKCSRQFERKSSQISHEKFCRFGGSIPTPTVTEKKKVVLGTAGAVAHHRCIKCGRSFKLKSSQISHSKFCNGNAFRKPSPSPKEKQKPVPSPVKDIPEKPKIVVYRQLIPDECSRPKRDGKKKSMSKDFVSSQSLKWRSANKVEAVSSSKDTTTLSKTVSDQSTQKIDTSPKKIIESTIKKVVSATNQVNLPYEAKSATVLKIASRIQTPQQSKPPSFPTKTSPSETKSPTLAKPSSTGKSTVGLMVKSPQDSKNMSVNVIEGRMYSIINAQKLSCLKCSRKFSTFSNLRRHAATHIGWMRFRCKHCSYQCFNRSDCRSHIQRMHPGTYTNVGNLDRNIVKLATGKLNVRRGDLMPDGTVKLSTKGASIHEVKSPSEVHPKLPKAVSSVVLKSSPTNVSMLQTSPLTVTPKLITKTFKEVSDVKQVKPVTSLVLKTPITEPPSDPPTVIKYSARKSTGGIPKKLLKSTGSARKSTGGVPKKIFKSSARKSTGGVPKKLLKSKPASSPTFTIANISSSPQLTSRKKSSPSSTQVSSSTNTPPSPKTSSKKKSSPGSSPELTNLPRTIKCEASSGISSPDSYPKVINIVKPARKGEISSDTKILETFPKIISVVKPPKKCETNPALESPPKVINVVKPTKKVDDASATTSAEISTKVINLLKTSKKGDVSVEPSSLEISPKIMSILKTPKVVDVSSATTKPHVILLNALRSGKTEGNPNVYVLSSPRTRSDKTDASTTTLVTRAGTYTKTGLVQKIPVKTSVRQRNSQSSSESSEPNANSNIQLLDHQYT